MRSRTKHGIHSILTGWLLVLAAFLGAITDTRASIVIEHTHAEGHHRHEHEAQCPQDIHSELCDGDEAPDDHDESQSGGDTHDHIVDLPNIPFCCVSHFTGGLMPPSSDRSNSIPASENGPDGPCFELIKPPQIG
jgi:hypothetical protein